MEDNPTDAELIMRALRRNHLANHVEIVENGEEALDFLFSRGNYAEYAGQSLPRVVFLDLKLPKVNGLEVLREIKKNEATRKLPVVIVTSSREDPDIDHAFDLGANSYVVKPLLFEEFTRAISNLGLYWLILNEQPKKGIAGYPKE